MTDEIAGDEAPAKRQSKTRQFYGFMGVTNYNEAFIQELSRDFEEGGYYHDHDPLPLEERIVVDDPKIDDARPIRRDPGSPSPGHGDR
jgi:hypothetical protein